MGEEGGEELEERGEDKKGKERSGERRGERGKGRERGEEGRGEEEENVIERVNKGDI